MTESFTSARVLYDADSNPVAEIEGTAVSTTHAGILLAGQDLDGNYKILRTTNRGKVQVEALAGAPSDLNQIVRQNLSNGGSPSMIVDGSVTPVDFVYDVGANDVLIRTLQIALSGVTIAFDGASFGKGGGILPNGVLIDMISNSVSATIATVRLNEDMIILRNRFFASATTDVMAVTVELGVTLVGGSGDRIRIRIQDDLTTGARDIKYFRAFVSGEVIS